MLFLMMFLSEQGGRVMESNEVKGNNGAIVGILILIALIVLIFFMFMLWRSNTL